MYTKGFDNSFHEGILSLMIRQANRHISTEGFFQRLYGKNVYKKTLTRANAGYGYSFE
jgi:hypothetical protein